MIVSARRKMKQGEKVDGNRRERVSGRDDM